MPEQPPAHGRRVDSDGVVRVEQRRASGVAWVLGLGIGLTCVCLVLSAWWVLSTPDAESLPELVLSEPPPEVAPPAAPPPVTRPVAKPAAKPALPKHLESQMANVPEEVLAQLPEGLYELPKPGEAPTGLMVFPPPGTDPVKKGIIVPEDFELPPGYVRHYQATDDGERLQAVLMFSPDKPPLDANGQPMKVTEDGLVPPELAPPGMPIQILKDPNEEEAEQEP